MTMMMMLWACAVTLACLGTFADAGKKPGTAQMLYSTSHEDVCNKLHGNEAVTEACARLCEKTAIPVNRNSRYDIIATGEDESAPVTHFYGPASRCFFSNNEGGRCLCSHTAYFFLDAFINDGSDTTWCIGTDCKI